MSLEMDAFGFIFPMRCQNNAAQSSKRNPDREDDKSDQIYYHPGKSPLA